MNKTRMGKRAASLLLSLVMMLSLLPTAAYAAMADGVDTQGAIVSENGTDVSDDSNSSGNTDDLQVGGSEGNGDTGAQQVGDSSGSGTAGDTTGAEGGADPTDSANENDSADPQDDGDAVMPVASSVVSTSEELVAAIAAANDGDTITLGEGEFTTYGNTSPKKSLTFVGAGTGTVWTIGNLSKDVKGEGNGDCSFDGCETITFQNMTLKSDGADYRGFIRISNTAVKKCTLVGKTAYWGYETAKFEDSTFNAPVGDYALWDYSTKAMTFEGCTFNISGKGVNVYVEQPSTDARTVEVNGCTVNSDKAGKVFLNIKNSTQAFDVTLSGTNTVTGLEANGTTGSALYQVETTEVTETTGKPVAVKAKADDGTVTTLYEVKETVEASVAEVNGAKYKSLQAAIDAASRNAIVTLLADTRENVTIATAMTLDLNGHTLNGGQVKAKPALTVTARVTVKDSSAAQTGTIMREDTVENSGVSSHYVIDIQGKGWLTFESGNVKNNSGVVGVKGASLVRVGDDSVAEYPGLTISGGTFTQDNFIVIKVDRGTFYLKEDGTLNSKNSYAVENWKFAEIKGGTVNGTVAAWTYSGGHNSDLTISGGTVNGNVLSVNYGSAEGKLAKVSITGGTVNGALDTRSYDPSTNELTSIDDATKATIAVTGGTFSSAVDKSLCAEGYIPTQNADGTYGVKEGKYVAEIGSQGYESLQEAVAAAEDGQTVTLLADATEDVVISKSITLDLGGKTLTNTNAGKATISVTSGTVTVKNGNVVGGNDYYNIEVTKNSGADLTLTDVTATAGNTGSSMIDNWGTLTITSGTYTGGLNVVKSEEGSKLTITGGTFTRETAPRWGITGTVLVYGTTTITGGTFNEKSTSTNARVVVTGRVDGYDSITYVKGGTFNGNGNNVFHHLSPAQADDSFEVSGGTFNKSIPDYYCADGFIPTKNAGGTYGVKEGQYVAKVGSKKYETLADAIRLAAKGKTITLLADVEQNTQLTINKNITLDLNGKTIKNTADIWGDNANAILSITNGAKVTITGNGTIDAKENDCYTINVVKGDLTIENGTFYGNVSVVQMEEGTLSVKGGTFDLHQKWEGSSKYLFNCIDSEFTSGNAKVAISGGTFVGFDPNVSPEQKVDGKTPSFAAPGVGITKNENGSFTAVDGMTAQILDKDGNSVNAYSTLAEAVAAAQDGQTVRLLADVEQNTQLIINKSITLDLNGKTIKISGYTAEKAQVSVKGNLTIQDSSEAQTGKICSDYTGTAGRVVSVENGGKLTIAGGTITTEGMSGLSGSAVYIASGAEVNMTGGAVKVDAKRGNVAMNVKGSTGVFTMSGGSVIAEAGDGTETYITAISGSSGSTIQISAGTVSGPQALFARSSATTITGGSFTGSITVKNGSISGGTFDRALDKKACAAGYVPTQNGDGTYGVEIGMFTVMVTSRTTGSNSPVANVTGGGSDITYAQGTTVTASAISGYKFVGWFVNEYTGTPYSTDLTCVVKPTDDCTMIAVYEPISGGKFWLTVTASEFTVNGGAVQDSYLYEQFAVGASVTVNFTGSENFLYWVNASNKVVSTDKSYTFIMGSETTLKAVYGKARQNQATVVFISHSDQIISSKAYTTSDTIQFPVPPIKMGCTFTGWSMTESEIREAMANNNGIIQVRARYTEPSIACTVTVVYPEGTDNQVVNAVVGKAIDVTAKDIEGKTFSYWTDNAGNILGYTKTLKLAPSGDMTVKAVYDQAAEAKPVITMSEVSATTANESYVVTFMATRAVPNGYKVVKQGILWSRDAVCGEDGAAAYMQFDSNGKLPDGVRAYIGNNLDLNGVTRYDIITKYNDRTFYGRGYMVLESDAGKLLYIYTDTIASGSYDSLTK